MDLDIKINYFIAEHFSTKFPIISMWGPTPGDSTSTQQHEEQSDSNCLIPVYNLQL